MWLWLMTKWDFEWRDNDWKTWFQLKFNRYLCWLKLYRWLSQVTQVIKNWFNFIFTKYGKSWDHNNNKLSASVFVSKLSYELLINWSLKRHKARSNVPIFLTVECDMTCADFVRIKSTIHLFTRSGNKQLHKHIILMYFYVKLKHT